MDNTTMTARVREALRLACQSCPTCTEEEAEVPTEEQLMAWLRGQEDYWQPGHESAAWISHLPHRELVLQGVSP